RTAAGEPPRRYPDPPAVMSADLPAISLRRYTDGDADSWNRFVAASKNGTLLIDRNYMDYHRHRFDDHSLMAADTDGELLAVIPAHRRDDMLVSHGGLTYGGVISGSAMTPLKMLGLFAGLLAHIRAEGMRGLYYKTIPRIYQRQPADEDLFALFVHNAVLKRRDLTTVLDPQFPAPVQSRRKRGAKSATKAGLVAADSDRWEDFWAILSANLADRHNLKPVHSVEEIRLLHSRFPEAIRLWCVTQNDAVVGGAVMYLTERVAHIQYTASSPAGREANALDLLNFALIEAYSDRYFDFGISNEGSGRALNHGLIDYKEGFGARTVTHDHYEILLP
ncbi:MAG: GNAT family N-acetyltransferase, partial [Ferrovibrio sp.]